MLYWLLVTFHWEQTSGWPVFWDWQFKVLAVLEGCIPVMLSYPKGDPDVYKTCQNADCPGIFSGSDSWLFWLCLRCTHSLSWDFESHILWKGSCFVYETHFWSQNCPCALREKCRNGSQTWFLKKSGHAQLWAFDCLWMMYLRLACFSQLLCPVAVHVQTDFHLMCLQLQHKNPKVSGSLVLSVMRACTLSVGSTLCNVHMIML